MKDSACLAVLAVVLVIVVLTMRLNTNSPQPIPHQWDDDRAELRSISENSPFMRNER
jgi:hypothetical protein